jgi:hypothetical protein
MKKEFLSKIRMGKFQEAQKLITDIDSQKRSQFLVELTQVAT